MKIDFNKEGGNLNVAIDGRLDTTTAPALEEFFGKNCDGACTTVIDCKGLSYVSSAGLRVLLATHKKTKGKMKLKNVCDVVMEVFEITGFADIFEIE